MRICEDVAVCGNEEARALALEVEFIYAVAVVITDEHHARDACRIDIRKGQRCSRTAYIRIAGFGRYERRRGRSGLGIFGVSRRTRRIFRFLRRPCMPVIRVFPLNARNKTGDIRKSCKEYPRSYERAYKKEHQSRNYEHTCGILVLVDNNGLLAKDSVL